jgi:hypothetical protein
MKVISTETEECNLPTPTGTDPIIIRDCENLVDALNLNLKTAWQREIAHRINIDLQIGGVRQDAEERYTSYVQ